MIFHGVLSMGMEGVTQKAQSSDSQSVEEQHTLELVITAKV
jgi:hypothetical protein